MTWVLFHLQNGNNKKKRRKLNCLSLSAICFTKVLSSLPPVSIIFVLLMLCCSHPESGHLFSRWGEPKSSQRVEGVGSVGWELGWWGGNSQGVVPSTGAETKELLARCRLTQCLQGAQTLHRTDHHYHFDNIFSPSKTKHSAGKTPGAILRELWMLTNIFSSVKNKLRSPLRATAKDGNQPIPNREDCSHDYHCGTFGIRGGCSPTLWCWMDTAT